MSSEKEVLDDEWKIFTLTKELEETKKALENRENQIKDLKKRKYWFGWSYRKHLDSL